MSQRSLEAFCRSRCIARETRQGVAAFSRQTDPQVRQGGLASSSRRPMGRIHVHAWMATAQQCRREKGEIGHRKVLPRTTTTPVVLKVSATDEKTEQLPAKECGEQKIPAEAYKVVSRSAQTRTHEYSQQVETRQMYVAQRR